MGDVPSCDGNVLDSTSDNVALRTRNDVGNTIARIDDRAGQGTISNPRRGPGGREGKDCLDCDVETLDVERFKENLRSLLSVLWRVQWWFRLGAIEQYDN